MLIELCFFRLYKMGQTQSNYNVNGVVDVLVEKLQNTNAVAMAETLRAHSKQFDLLPNFLSDILVLFLFIGILIIGAGVYFMAKKVKALEENLNDTNKHLRHKIQSATFSKLTTPNVKFIDEGTA